MKIITDILHHSGTNPAEKKKLEIEQEAWRTVDALTSDLREKSEMLIQELNESKIALTQKEFAITEMAKQLEDLKRKLAEK